VCSCLSNQLAIATCRYWRSCFRCRNKLDCLLRLQQHHWSCKSYLTVEQCCGTTWFCLHWWEGRLRLHWLHARWTFTLLCCRAFWTVNMINWVIMKGTHLPSVEYWVWWFIIKVPNMQLKHTASLTLNCLRLIFSFLTFISTSNLLSCHCIHAFIIFFFHFNKHYSDQ